MSPYLQHFATLSIDEMEKRLRRQAELRFEKTGRYVPVEHAAMISIYQAKRRQCHDAP